MPTRGAPLQSLGESYGGGSGLIKGWLTGKPNRETARKSAVTYKDHDFLFRSPGKMCSAALISSTLANSGLPSLIPGQNASRRHFVSWVCDESNWATPWLGHVVTC